MTRPAIYEPAMTQWVADGREIVRGIYEADHQTAKHEKLAGESREAGQMRRYELGALLLKVRDTLPRRGTRESGWLAYLEAIEVDDSSAHRYMDMVRNPARSQQDPLRSSGPALELVPPPTDDDAPPQDGAIDPDEIEIDRDTWCTPQWITDALGEVDLDPCANERSHVQAGSTFRLDLDQDGLELAPTVGHDWRVFLNPPYSDVPPWIAAYGHTRFCFLLKLDPSTKWFAALLERAEIVLIPKLTRVQFEAPEGVPDNKTGAVQFPHALFFARDEDAPQALRDRCYVWRVER